MNYDKRRKKHKKKKVNQRVRRRMDELEAVYGVDARQLAGLTGGLGGVQYASPNKKGGPESDGDLAMRSTRYTAFRKGMRSHGKDSVQQSRSGWGRESRLWNDIHSTLRGDPMDVGASAARGRIPGQRRKKMTQTQKKFA